MTLDFGSPKRLFLSLIHPISFDNFFSQYWEEKPLHLARNQGLTGSTSDGILSLSHRTLRNFVKSCHLQCGKDVDILRYSNCGKKESLNENGILSLTKYDKLVTGGSASACFNELQRHQDNLWQLVELLESFFGTLVGSKVIVSPSSAQRSLTPLQSSNAETFIIQTEGETQWRLYFPVSPLSRNFLENVSSEHLGEPTHEVLLRAGDLLYLPRGTVYQNTSIVTNTHATHLVVYTYQKASWGDYLQSVFPSLIKEAVDSDLDFRRGLPINFLKSTKLTKSRKFQSVLGILLLKLSKARLERFPLPKDLMEKFMEKRMPPFRANPSLLRNTLPGGTPPDLSCKVRLKYPEHLCFLIADRSDVDDSCLTNYDLASKTDSFPLDDSANTQFQFLSQSLFGTDESQALFVFSSLLNSRVNHMVPSLNKQVNEHAALTLVLPTSFYTSLETLKASSEQFVAAICLPLEDPADREQLIRALWSKHLIECIPGFRAEPCKITKLD
ncbi:ribosomal oxygenase 2-like [Frankliniella occidentalis]|uniref:Bifunctional lysine-specific demethylase and histidyl-hydroxylase n=1 Tax=Frankliniella occidentalis TaxID=133901 RepID=A0A6J1S0J0_FRAOC|nr:ribosomal oxygenase 2-like [Frankliniella occidentalis]XP_052119600.1 ribosomal oxygenase 2-like [Frankliniella occidentalis]XP_052119601.1 ribosomal oxygenase 2-like [Frankliniella occidentalis]